MGFLRQFQRIGHGVAETIIGGGHGVHLPGQLDLALFQLIPLGVMLLAADGIVQEQVHQFVELALQGGVFLAQLVHLALMEHLLSFAGTAGIFDDILEHIGIGGHVLKHLLDLSQHIGFPDPHLFVGVLGIAADEVSKFSLFAAAVSLGLGVGGNGSAAYSAGNQPAQRIFLFRVGKRLAMPTQSHGLAGIE